MLDAFLANRWDALMRDPVLRDLPFKVELNRLGQILMCPASSGHGRTQYRIARRLESQLPGGEIIIACPIATRNGVRVADVAWASAAFMAEFGTPTVYPKAPEICVEVMSASNTEEEMQEKISLYLERGAQEVWIQPEDGALRVYSHTGLQSASRLAPGL